ncbi:hypothetical protein EVB91_161 [Rhizobium phage RHph_I1_18]|nr:hypothetical protein EVB91_161 [Rhizobium phage RHph_I1_18]
MKAIAFVIYIGYYQGAFERVPELGPYDSLEQCLVYRDAVKKSMEDQDWGNRIYPICMPIAFSSAHD